MVIDELKIKNFRNIKDMTIIPHEKYNLIFGANAQGKTSILEAIWMLSGCKSFRTPHERAVVNHKEEFCEVSLKGHDENRPYELYFRTDGKYRKVLINNVPKNTQGLFNSLKCIVFTPTDVEIIKGPPENRRSFIDYCYSQLYVTYTKAVNTFNYILKQRNSAIKQITEGLAGRELLESFNAQYCLSCGIISTKREEYAYHLNNCANRLYKEISGGKENLTVEYAPHFFTREEVESFKDINDFNKACERFRFQLSNNFDQELRYGHTLSGAHKDELHIRIDGYSVREFGSQGQQKSAALALKLAQAHIYRSFNKDEKPVILLDDVMCELDEERRNVVFGIIKDMQVFITSCNENAFKKNDMMKEFRISCGEIV